MPPFALIIEDEDSVGKAIAEVCTSLGIESSVAKRGADAITAFDARPPDLVTLDLLLPGGMDGRKVAEAIRGKIHGEQTPIIVISGFIKDPKAQADLQAAFRIKTFLSKPLKADDLRSALAASAGIDVRASANPAAPKPSGPLGAHERAGMDSFQLELGVRAPYSLFAELHRAKAEGVLELVKGNAKKRFWIQRGFFRYATSNIKAENLAGLLLAKGAPEGPINEGLQLARTKGISTPDALLQTRAVMQSQLAALLTQQTEEVAITSHQWTEGTAIFKAGASDTSVEGRANPLICVIKGVKRFVNASEARMALQAEPKGPLERTPELDREMFALKNLFPGETLMPMINGRATLAEITAKTKEADLVLLHALTVSGLARVKGAPPAAAADELAAAAKPVATRPNRDYTPEEDASRTLIRAEARRQQGAVTHYQVLGVAPTADASMIKGAYLKLARTFHTDAFSGQELGDQGPVLEQVFKRISEANAEIGDAAHREEYDTYLDRKAKGLPTDMGDILKADNSFSRGEAARKAGRLKDADALYREAVQLNPGEPNYAIALARTMYSLKGKDAGRECLELLDKALQFAPESLPALKLRGVVLMGLNRAIEAIDTFRKLQGINPSYEDTPFLLRDAKAAAKAPAESEKGGLLGKLFWSKDK